MEASKYRVLSDHLGGPCLAYLLNCSVQTIDQFLTDTDGPPAFNEEQQLVLAELLKADHSLADAEHPDLTSFNWARHLSTRIDDSEQSVGNNVRLFTGGSVFVLPSEDTHVESLLSQLAVDMYPGFLVRITGPLSRLSSVSTSFYNHPLKQDFYDAVMSDDVLARLFSDENETLGRHGSSVRSSGSGGGVQLWTFADLMLTCGWNLARRAGADPTPELFIEKTIEAVSTTRTALDHKSATIAVSIGLTGVLLPDGADVLDFGFAAIRKADDRDAFIASSTGLDGQLTGTDEQGSTAIINYSGDLVMEMDIPYVVELISSDPEKLVDFPDSLLVHRNAIERNAQNLSLGLLLAFPETRPRLLTTWQAIYDPLSSGLVIGWSDVRQSPGFMPRKLTVEQVEEWAKWSGLIARLRTPSVDVALSRMLASVAERRRPDDVLVDAVIVWENLFGARTETNLRVTSSLAWLLGGSEEDRRMKQTNYKKIYGFRSAVVHGMPSPNNRKLSEMSQEAVTIAIEALRAVFLYRPELLDEKDSEMRSLRIMHAGPVST